LPTDKPASTEGLWCIAQNQIRDIARFAKKRATGRIAAISKRIECEIEVALSFANLRHRPGQAKVRLTTDVWQ